MSLHTWYLKTFKKNEIVRLCVYGKSKHIRNYYVRPLGNTATCNKVSYIINDKDFYLDSDNIITYTYREDSVEPVNPFDSKRSVMSQEEFNVAIDNKIIRDLVQSTGNGFDMATISMIISVVSLLGILFVGYMVYEQQTLINEMREVLRVIGGI